MASNRIAAAADALVALGECRSGGFARLQS